MAMARLRGVHTKVSARVVVSASIKGGVVQTVALLSEAGMDCTFVSPWPAATGPPVVTASGKPVAGYISALEPTE